MKRCSKCGEHKDWSEFGRRRQSPDGYYACCKQCRGRNHGRQHSPSIDRIDSSKGYVPENIAVMSARANTIKNCGSAAEHQMIADWMRRQNVA